MTRLAGIILALKSHNTDEQDAAAEGLRGWSEEGLPVEEGILALKAAAQPFPPRIMDWKDSAGDLVEAAAESPWPEYIPVVVEHYPLYPKGAKTEALRLLAKLPQREAAVAFMDLLRCHARQGDIPHLITMPLRSDPRHADVFFPEILSYTDIEAFRWDINLLLLSYLEEGLVAPETVSGYGESILESYTDYESKLMPVQQAEGIAWIWEQSYQDLRDTACLYLDLLGFFVAPSAKEAVRRAFSFADPRMVFFAVRACVQRGEDVDPTHLFNVAASAEMRNWLYNELDRLGKLSLFPHQFATQAAFAESNMVGWLIFPTELGRAPDEIELMHVSTFDTQEEEGLVDHYVFRFRTLEPHWAAKDGWMAGVSGPFIQKNAPSTRAYGDTFSRFDAWESKTAEEHLRANLDNLDNWHTEWSKT